jgi:hypothetical protein
VLAETNLATGRLSSRLVHASRIGPQKVLSPGTYIGTLSGVVLADPDVQSLSRGTDTGTVEGNATARGAFASIEALLGAPVGAAITLQHNDIVVFDQGVSLQLVGPRTYGRRNVITGQPMRINGVSYYYLRAVALA